MSEFEVGDYVTLTEEDRQLFLYIDHNRPLIVIDIEGTGEMYRCEYHTSSGNLDNSVFYRHELHFWDDEENWV